MGVLSWIWMLLILFSKIVVTVFWMAGESAGESACPTLLRRSIERWLPGNQLGLPENAFLQNEVPLEQILQRLQAR